MKKNKGFTLIELLIVILILGILMAIIIPNYIRFQENARRVSVKANMRVIQTALEGWAVNNDGMYPPAEDYVLDPNNEDGLAPYLPGGDPIGEGGTPTLGSFPMNPYTHARYNSGTTPDITYNGTILGARGQNAIIKSTERNCPYLGLTAGTRGEIRILLYIEEEDQTAATEYGVCGWGRAISDDPMYEYVGSGTDRAKLYFALFNN